MNIRNAKYTETGTIECEIEHPEFGWIPFHATQNDPDEKGRLVYEEAVQGTVAAYEPVSISEEDRLNNWRLFARVTPRQARLALIQNGLLAGVDAAIDAIEEPDRSIVATEWQYASVIERSSPWINTMASALGLTDEQMDDLFELAATL